MVISDMGLVDTTLTNPTPGTEQTIELTFDNFQPVHDGVYHCFASASDTMEELSSDLYLYGSGMSTSCVREWAHHHFECIVCA